MSLSSLYLENLDAKALPLLERAYSQAEDSKNWPKIANNYAVSLAWAKDFKQARSVHRKILRKNKATSLSLINYAVLLIEQFEDGGAAQEILEQADFLAQNKSDQNRIKQLRKQIRQRRGK